MSSSVRCLQSALVCFALLSAWRTPASAVAVADASAVIMSDGLSPTAASAKNPTCASTVANRAERVESFSSCGVRIARQSRPLRSCSNAKLAVCSASRKTVGSINNSSDSITRSQSGDLPARIWSIPDLCPQDFFQKKPWDLNVPLMALSFSAKTKSELMISFHGADPSTSIYSACDVCRKATFLSTYSALDAI